MTPLRELKPELFEDERITDDEDSEEYGNKNLSSVDISLLNISKLFLMYSKIPGYLRITRRWLRGSLRNSLHGTNLPRKQWNTGKHNETQ